MSNKIKICALSDMHGELPPVPSCDICLIAGDLCPATNHSVDFQEYWLETTFNRWLKDIDAKFKIFIAGNHDFFFERVPQSKICKTLEKIAGVYLQDSSTECYGLKIYGSAWTPYFYDWAFNLYECDLEKKWAKIPNDTDILVVHGPPHGYGDLAPRIIKNKNEQEWPGGEHTGSPSLLKKITEVKPKLVVFGHIHEGYGQWMLENTILANVSVLNGQYVMTRNPMTFEITAV